MPQKDWTAKDIVGCDVLALAELKTSEGQEDQRQLARLVKADDYAADLIIGGVLLPIDGGPIRLSEAIRAVSGKERALCEHCEDALWNAIQQEEAAYFVGMAVGLRLAQVTDMRDKAFGRRALLHRAGLDRGAR